MMNDIRKIEIMNLETGEWLTLDKALYGGIPTYSTDKKSVNDMIHKFYQFKFDNIKIEKITRNNRTLYYAARYIINN